MDKKIPHWLRGYIQSNDIDAIEKAVQSAELKTSGEIVPIIVHKSSTTGHVPLILILIFTSLYFFFGAWDLQLEMGLNPWLVAPLDFAVILLAVAFLSRLHCVMRWLTPKQDLIAQTEQRALVEFYNHRVNHTDAATGILVFLSILERRAIVLGDEAIAKKLPAESWQKIVDSLTQGIRKKQTLKGLIQAIEMCGDHLTHHFPRAHDDVDELENHLIIKE